MVYFYGSGVSQRDVAAIGQRGHIPGTGMRRQGTGRKRRSCRCDRDLSPSSASSIMIESPIIGNTRVGENNPAMTPPCRDCRTKCLGWKDMEVDGGDQEHTHDEVVDWFATKLVCRLMVRGSVRRRKRGFALFIDRARDRDDLSTFRPSPRLSTYI